MQERLGKGRVMCNSSTIDSKTWTQAQASHFTVCKVEQKARGKELRTAEWNLFKQQVLLKSYLRHDLLRLEVKLSSIS